MNRVFDIPPPFRVPDGTWVSPFLNSKDNKSGLPFDLLDCFSIAAGRVDPGTHSEIHVMPLVTQVTFVRSGSLRVKMQGKTDDGAYELNLEANRAVLTEPGVAFQLLNAGQQPCEVLYIVGPAYVFEMSADGQVRYDDATVLGSDWTAISELLARGATPEAMAQRKRDRESATKRNRGA